MTFFIKEPPKYPNNPLFDLSVALLMVVCSVGILYLEYLNRIAQ